MVVSACVGRDVKGPISDAEQKHKHDVLIRQHKLQGCDIRILVGCNSAFEAK